MTVAILWLSGGTLYNLACFGVVSIIAMKLVMAADQNHPVNLVRPYTIVIHRVTAYQDITGSLRS